MATNHPVAQNWVLWAERGYIDLVNISGYCFTNNYGEHFRQVFAKRMGDAVAMNRACQRPIQLSFALGVRTSHGEIHRAAEVEEYLRLAEDNGVSGCAVFTWGYLKPYYSEVTKADYFRKFAELH